MSRTPPYVALFIVMQAVCGAGLAQQPASTAVVGGRGGDRFSDADPPAGARVLEVHIRSGDHIDSVQMSYALPDGRTALGPRHGGSGGRLHVFRLDPGEYITGLSGRHGDYIDSLSVHTNRRASTPFGGRGGNRDFHIDVPDGHQGVGFVGRAGEYLDAVGLIFVPIHVITIRETTLVGGRGGSVFSDSAIPEEARMAQVRVRAGDRIDSVQAVYVLPNGRVIEGERHGGRGGRSDTFRLDSDEYIIGLSGRHGDYIDSVRIHTNRRTSQLFGGRGGNRDFRIEVPSGSRAVGFAGRAGEYVDAIGLTYAASEAPSRRVPRRRRPPDGVRD